MKYVVIFIISAFMIGCTSQQKISVKQNQNGQEQEVQIESSAKVDNLALIFNSYGSRN